MKRKQTAPPLAGFVDSVTYFHSQEQRKRKQKTDWFFWLCFRSIFGESEHCGLEMTHKQHSRFI